MTGTMSSESTRSDSPLRTKSVIYVVLFSIQLVTFAYIAYLELKIRAIEDDRHDESRIVNNVVKHLKQIPSKLEPADIMTIEVLAAFCRKTTDYCSLRREKRQDVTPPSISRKSNSPPCSPCPPGPPGPPCSPCPPGPPGPTGPPGPPGPPGLPGFAGDIVTAGLPGLLGPKGDSGSPGCKGDIGPIRMASPPGKKGDADIVGMPGLPGKAGNPDRPGKTRASGLVAKPGTRHPAEPTGSSGMPGLGDIGPAGQPGLVGPKGDSGSSDPPGLPSIAGDVGSAGQHGLLDPKGGLGSLGSKGDIVPEGKPGKEIGQKGAGERTTQKHFPPSEIDPNKVSPLSGHYKVVCYFTNWAWSRSGVAGYLPEHIDHTLCTHIVYGFADLDYSNLVIKARDFRTDVDNRFYERVVAYKQRGLKVLLALGGWKDSASDKYSRLVNSPSSRQKFIEHAVQFVEKYGFDGLDLDWEYPVCWQMDCRKGPKSDKEGFAAFLKELSAVFKPRGLLLSSAVSKSKKVIDEAYDVAALAKYLDWIAVMTYNFHGQWEKKTGHASPLFYHKDDEFYFLNANYTINYWISKGAPPRSLVMGMPLYGKTFSINDPSAGTGLSAPASAGTAGEFTKAAGTLAYYEICDRIRNQGWKVFHDPQRKMGPYAYKGNQWVSFDDADMIRKKAQYIRDMGLGGGMVWALDFDDFKGTCGDGPHPLMHALQQVLAEPPNKHDRREDLPEDLKKNIKN